MLAVVAFMILFGLAIIPLISSSSFQLSFQSNYDVQGYYADDGYHLLLFAHNNFGQPLSGISFNITSPSGKSVGATTNSSGFTEVLLPVNFSSTGIVNISSTMIRSHNEVAFLSQTPAGEVHPGVVIDPIADTKNASKVDFLVFATGPYFEKPDYSVYYTLSVNTQTFVPLNYTNMKFLTNLTEIVTILKPDVINNGSNYINFGVFTKNGSLILFASFPYNAQIAGPSPTQLATSFLTGVLSIFVPLMAILEAYSIYARDRVTGVLESVLVRPVTRQSLLSSRFLAGLLSSAVAILITILVVNAIILIKLNQSLSMSFIATSWASLVVEASSFIGITFIISQLTKSTGRLIGAGIGLFLVLDFLWTLFLFLAFSAAGVTFNSAESFRIQTLLDFLNPSQYLNLVQIYQTGTIAGVLVNPSDYGVNIFSLVSDGLFWLLFPIALSIWLVNRRD